MTAKQQAEWYKKHIEFTLDKLSITQGQYNTLKKYGKILRSLYEDQCNGFLDNNGNWDEKATQEAEKKEKQVTDEIMRYAKELGLCVYLQTDPRGATIYLDTKEIPENSYNNAHCIY